MALTGSDVIQGGALLVLFVFVMAFTVYFRERDKRSEELTKSIVTRALDSMDAGVKTQQMVAEALAKLCLTIDMEHGQREQEHKEILTAVRGLDRRILGRPKNAAG